jgi:hypothetical protein
MPVLMDCQRQAYSARGKRRSQLVTKRIASLTVKQCNGTFRSRLQGTRPKRRQLRSFPSTSGI